MYSTVDVFSEVDQRKTICITIGKERRLDLLISLRWIRENRASYSKIKSLSSSILRNWKLGAFVISSFASKLAKTKILKMITFLIIESDVLLTITQKMFWTYVIENWKFSTKLMNNGLKIDKLIQYCFSHIYAAWLENNTNWSYCNTCENDTTRRYTSSTPCQRTKQLNRK